MFNSQDFAYPLKIVPYLLNFSNIFLCNPYFIRHNIKDNKYEVCSFWAQKVVVGVFQILRMSSVILKVLGIFSRKETGLLLLLLIALYASWLLFNTSVIYVLWFQQHSLVQFLNLGKKVCHQVALPVTAARRKIAFIIAVALPFMLFGWSILDIFRTKRDYTRFYEDIRTDIFEISADILYQDIRNSSRTGTNQTFVFQRNFTTLDYMVGFVHEVVLLQASFILHLGFAICMSVSFVCWFIVKDFMTCVRTRYGYGNLPKVLDILDDLHDVLGVCSTSLGLLFCEVTLLYVPMYAMHLPLIASNDVIDVTQLFLFLSCVSLSLMPAGDVHSMVKS
ncbi:unnamed protein product [Allacma fusca]|uniref:Uncharacterized protein n=1 Tax=Allacma fusca TaxID=39272 RepID=A0A8J2JN16_9HEXA|nr:unnamed protein product [Allacma fusca]